VAVGWQVDVRVPDRGDYAGFYTMDLGESGVRLVGNPRDALGGRGKKQVGMRLHFPSPVGIEEVKAELKWEHDEGGSVQMGFAFTRISREACQAIEDYIEEHPEDVKKGK